jgi:hypothetical protein
MLETHTHQRDTVELNEVETLIPCLRKGVYEAPRLTAQIPQCLQEMGPSLHGPAIHADDAVADLRSLRCVAMSNDRIDFNPPNLRI